MPFGDNIKTYRVALPPGEMPPPGTYKVPARWIKVPEAPAPWWWSEYLMEEWKRKNGLTSRPRVLTKWQQEQDAWEFQEMRQRGAELVNNVRSGAPLHNPWGDQ